MEVKLTEQEEKDRKSFLIMQARILTLEEEIKEIKAHLLESDLPARLLERVQALEKELAGLKSGEAFQSQPRSIL